MSDSVAETTVHPGGGSFEVLLERLKTQAAALETRTKALNSKRLDIFGGTAMELQSSLRLRTDNACTPRDSVEIGGLFLSAWDVQLGLRDEIHVEDILTLHRLSLEGDRPTLEPVSLQGTFLAAEEFTRDFAELFRYYSSARLLELRLLPGRLLLIFQAGQRLDDTKVFRFGVDGDRVAYLDNRGEREHIRPASHDFTFTRTTRDDFRLGKHPHVNVLDEVFVETVGGDLTLKIEDNTETGRGIYSEPVEDLNQGLDDAELLYASIGSLILLKILPFRERRWRFLVYNRRGQKVHRVDALGHAARQLPEDHGLIFPSGYCLDDGRVKLFDADPGAMDYRRRIVSPNGEDILDVFVEPESGSYQLLAYNLIRREVTNPIACHGYSLFDDGHLLILKNGSNEARRVHQLQIWRTPFTTEEHAAQQQEGATGLLASLGNAEVVRAVSESLALVREARQGERRRDTYEELARSTTRLFDAHHWLAEDEAGNLAEAAAEVRQTAEALIEELEKVVALEREATAAVEIAALRVEELDGELQQSAKSVAEHVGRLRRLRLERGRIAGLGELARIDQEQLDSLQGRLAELAEVAGHDAVAFLEDAAALNPLKTRLAEVEAEAMAAPTTVEVKALAASVDELGEGLDALTEALGSIEIADPTRRTAILGAISEVFGELNRLRARAETRRQQLAESEGEAELAVALQVLAQQTAAALAMAGTPAKCDEQMARLLLQLEELESRFAEVDAFLEPLAERREELLEAFAIKRQQLESAQRRRSGQAFAAAERVLDAVQRRSALFIEAEELAAFYLADPMVTKLRELAERLRELGAGVRSDEVLTRLATAREEALRALSDRVDLMDEGGATIRFGHHRFTVDETPKKLAIVPWGNGLALHVTGTDFHEPLDEAELGDFRTLWDRILPSESPTVARSEYLAWRLLSEAQHGRGQAGLAHLQQVRRDGGLAELVQGEALERFRLGCERGVHDNDACIVLDAVLRLHETAATLRHPPLGRALACLIEAFANDAAKASAFSRRAASLKRLETAYGPSVAGRELIADIATWAGAELDEIGLQVADRDTRSAARVLRDELLSEGRFSVSMEADRLLKAFIASQDKSSRRLVDDLRELDAIGDRWRLALAWLEAFVAAEKDPRFDEHSIPESAAMLLVLGELEVEVSAALTRLPLEGLVSDHPALQTKELVLDDFLDRLERFEEIDVPAYEAFHLTRHRLLEEHRLRLRIDELEPRVLSTFVRNQLIDQAYLPLLGDNLAKQLGAVGEGARTDRQGLLLLISPPGYGKTTLMEYVAARLGLVFVKINGPSLGHSVVSLDPDEAPNATARQEVEKIGFALEMGANVILYLDDIQHTSPELLQKFISLCDAQRRIEGVWCGRSKTYDLRGKRFCVVMAGNPYTESGEAFQIPDMLANRADVYNLGEVLSGKQALFARSYIENALISNLATARLSGRCAEDRELLIRHAEGEAVNLGELRQPLSEVELADIIAVLRLLVRIRDVLLQVNANYVSSAAQEEAYRVEPRFQLQGSYRNMARMAAKVVPAMNSSELEALIDDHYLSEAQTLTTGAEHNLLKLAELRGRMSAKQAERWNEIKAELKRQRLLGGSGDDPASRAIAQLSLVSDGLGGIVQAIEQRPQESGNEDMRFVGALEGLAERIGKRGEAAPPAIDPAAFSQAFEAGFAKLAGGFRELAEKLPEALAQAPVASVAKSRDPELAASLERLAAALETGHPTAAPTTIVRRLPTGAHELLRKMITTIDADMLPTVRGMSKKLREVEALPSKRVQELSDRTLKNLDVLKDLLQALEKVDEL